MDKSFVAEMKSVLEVKLAKLEAELKAFSLRDPHATENYNASFPDYGNKEDENASEVATFSDNLSLEHTLEGTLSDVVRALERIKAGTYGVCKYCRQEIDQRRLRARPESGSCVACKKKLLEKA